MKSDKKDLQLYKVKDSGKRCTKAEKALCGGSDFLWGKGRDGTGFRSQFHFCPAGYQKCEKREGAAGL